MVLQTFFGESHLSSKNFTTPFKLDLLRSQQNVLAVVFYSVMLSICGAYLSTSSNQFGYKKGHSAMH